MNKAMRDNFQIQTFGCKVNHHDSVLMGQRLREKGLESPQQVVVVNSCAVTREAGKEALRLAGKVKREKPESLVVVTGCGAQADTKIYEESPYVDLVVGNSHRDKLPDILKEFLKSPDRSQKVFKSNIFKTSDLYSGSLQREEDRTRTF